MRVVSSLAHKLIWSACLVAGLAAGCGSPEIENSAAPLSERSLPPLEFFAQRINLYAETLYGKDPAPLQRLLSSEVLDHMKEAGLDLAGYHAKQRASMLRTFEAELAKNGPSGQFSAAAVDAEGDAVRVTLAMGGQKLEKPFYFVYENGDYKLNVLRPGFSKQAPEEAALATDTYSIWCGRPSENPSCSLACAASKTTNHFYTVPNQHHTNVSCYNTCGFWHGSTFTNNLKCDYNTWGTDVYVTQTKGFNVSYECNDGC
jgi:hypothetical protein